MKKTSTGGDKGEGMQIKEWVYSSHPLIPSHANFFRSNTIYEGGEILPFNRQVYNYLSPTENVLKNIHDYLIKKIALLILDLYL